MRIRPKLIVLVACVTAVPILVTAVAGVAIRRDRHASGPLSQYNFPAFKRWVDTDLARRWPEHTAEGIEGLEPPGGMSVIILDLENTVVVSNVAAYQPGDVIHPRSLQRDATDRRFSGRVFLQPFFVSGRLEGTLLAQMPARDWYAGPSVAFRLDAQLYGLIALILLAPVLVALIARNLNRSIARLEAAAARIAQGDLNFQLEVSGRDEVASLAGSFDKMRQSLLEERGRRSRFLMAVSHDVRTPLTSIKGYLEAISDGLATNPEQLRRYVGIAREKADVLDARLTELIQFVRVESGEWQLKPTTVYLADFCRKIVNDLEDNAVVFHREFTSEIQLPIDVMIEADADLLSRVLENLVDNAIRYTAEGDKISLSAKLGADLSHAVVTIADTGSGVLPQDLPFIFDPFYRSTNSRRERGTGLGLSIVRSIAQAHGWQVVAESVHGQGAAFVLSIPGIARGNRTSRKPAPGNTVLRTAL